MALMVRMLPARPAVVLAIAVLAGACTGTASSGPTQVPPAPSASPAVVSATGALSPGSGASLPSPPPTPLQPGPNVRAAGLLSPSDGWALTGGGLFLTVDGGRTWRPATVPGPRTGRGTLGVAFIDSRHGWLATLDSTDAHSNSFDVWRTGDGGRTWQRAVLAEGANRSDTMGNVTFSVLGPDRLYLLVEGGMPNGYVSDLYASTDGGRTWSPDRATGPGGVTGALAFADAAHGVVAGGAPGSRLFVTADAGRSWSRVAYPVPTGANRADTHFPDGPTFFDARDGALAATYSTDGGAVDFGVLVTASAGASWALASSVPESATNDVPVAFLSPAHWLAAAGASTAFATTDAGATWTRYAMSGLPDGPQWISFSGAQHGWALVPLSVCLRFKSDCSARTGLYATSDGGRTWTALWPR